RGMDAGAMTRNGLVHWFGDGELWVVANRGERPRRSGNSLDLKMLEDLVPRSKVVDDRDASSGSEEGCQLVARNCALRMQNQNRIFRAQIRPVELGQGCHPRFSKLGSSQLQEGGASLP